MSVSSLSLPPHTLFSFNDTAATEIYTLSLHDALPILPHRRLVLPQPGETPQEGLRQELAVPRPGLEQRQLGLRSRSGREAHLPGRARRAQDPARDQRIPDGRFEAAPEGLRRA